MKTLIQISAVFVLLFIYMPLSAQWSGGTGGNDNIHRTGKVNIGVNAPASDNHQLHVKTNSGNQVAAIYGEILQAGTAGGDRNRAVYGRMESGAGWAYGVVGAATTEFSSSAGRAFGVYGVAGNATPGANYGGQFMLTGTNAGSALIAVDRLTPEGDSWASSSGLVDNTRSWAGYFIGDVQMTHKLGVGCDDYTAPSAGTVDYHVFVNGGIRALELHVDNSSWCDYVFENDYELTTLKEVEQHIKTNGHLHNTLSAKEIDENGGFELSEMTRNQQEKIEEIFLHLINLEKEMETVKKENTVLKAIIENK